MIISGEPKVKNLVIHLDTGHTIGPRGLPLIYGNQDALTLLHATITFESSHGCKAKGVDISFKAAAKSNFFAKDETSRKLEGEQVFYSKHWELSVEQPKPGWIAKGNYARQCSVVLDPSIPSSNESPFGSMRYVFEARLKGAKGFGIARMDMVVVQEVWVLNSTLPFLGTLTLDNPTSVRKRWKASLPYSLTIPSDTLYLGQVVPLTFQLMPFRVGTAFEGEEVVVTSASFTLRETKTFRAMFVRDVHETVDKLLHIAVNTGWPQSVDGWQRTIHVSLPSSPAMSTDMQTKYLDITHSLIVAIEFRTSKITKTEKLWAQLDVLITAPRTTSTEPPHYGETAIPVESLLMLEPPPAIDAEELPSYSRYDV
ncbi:hypothetical protein BG011_006785 [Mortierella polycephala]|uniref:Arrestin-like N-terminal domain-containing protein n=1 Tax=Mortierella polycephala TaxID=41804 RepID=A0A9P6QK35_9FUNG|nr:hypothetical protein BG011_006785 [Mortierella polycephala]